MFTGKGLLLNQSIPIQQQINILESQLGRIYENLYRIRFGDGVDGNRGENIDGEWQIFTSDGSVDTEFSVTHGLGVTPIGIIVCGQDKAGSLYQLDDTGTAWTSTTIHLKCDVASVKFKSFLLK